MESKKTATPLPTAIGTETLAVLVGLYLTLACNGALWAAFAAAVDLRTWHGARVGAAFFVAVTALQTVLILPLLMRWNARAVLTAVIALSAAAAFYMRRYTVYLDTDMVRTVLHTEPKEAGELLTGAFFLHMLLFAAVPGVLVWRVRLRDRPWRAAILHRAGAIAVGILVAVVAAGIAFADLAALMRNHEQMRYLITPGNALVAAARVAAGDVVDEQAPRHRIGTDARVVAAAGAKPKLLVIVVGETVRAGNWGLDGYARQTTPELAALDVFNFRDVTACGSNTEVSLPCMFSARGRRHYDEAAIRRSESLLHVLEHAGVATLWRDNQTGCKGVCDGLAAESFLRASDPRWCDGERCLDEILLSGLAKRIDADPRDRVVVLHQLGAHGPSYSRRYPPAFRRFTPTCETADLGDCDRAAIVNAYDNAILYTDHFVARTIAALQADPAYDTALLYVSDHGESLGEHSLYLHGVPYAIAPDVQVKVPMVLWLSPQWQASRGVDRTCIERRLAAPASHDNLFSTVLGIMQVRTEVYEPALDLLAGCTAEPGGLASATLRRGGPRRG